MAFARARALRSIQTAFRQSSARATAPARTQLAVGRRYASGGGHGHAEPSSDLPWALGAVVVTVPSVWFLWPDSTKAEHHGGHDDHHEETHEEAHEDKQAEEAPAAEEEEKEEKPASDEKDTSDEQEQAKESEQDSKPSGSEGESQPKSSDANKVSEPKDVEGAEKKETPASGGNTDDVKFKGPAKEGSAATDDERKVEPDDKGGYKKRIDSKNAVNLGEEAHLKEGAYAEKEAPSPGKQPDKSKSPGSMEAKQYGMSNTATKHSHKIDEDPEKSKKPEGGPDTAKTVGTVDPNRPQK
ncbi:hypothetical protein EJ03DRAFT_328929 [Teratosphaeria nubilosa]|uniref:Uncharacterized protein n=1 Tax=Teratosphaeria nubilosa TaxID=161662 RepID=A0A6G1L4E5_9PEZI|nr:hypothetical protein EJ03DRAFT_328929 [Teratosphaeria nubilosa]